jgi:hypothetical protein
MKKKAKETSESITVKDQIAPKANSSAGKMPKKKNSGGPIVLEKSGKGAA